MINLLKKLGDIIRELNSKNETPHLAMEKIPNDIQPGVISDTALENTISNKKKQKGFFKIEERANGDFSWNIIPIERLVDSTLKKIEDVFDITEKPLKKLSELDRLMY